jgi:hypothetical protein
MVDIYEKFDESLFNELEKLLSKIKVPRKSLRNNRPNFPARCRAMSLGLSKGRFDGIIGLSYYSKKYAEIYAEVVKIGEAISPHFNFQSIHLNNNVVCPKHLDSKNVGESVLVSFGDYEGCNIVIEGEIYDAKHTPIKFNGALMEHWNTNDLVGNKYSLVFYNSGLTLKNKL